MLRRTLSSPPNAHDYQLSLNILLSPGFSFYILDYLSFLIFYFHWISVVIISNIPTDPLLLFSLKTLRKEKKLVQ